MTNEPNRTEREARPRETSRRIRQALLDVAKRERRERTEAATERARRSAASRAGANRDIGGQAAIHGEPDPDFNPGLQAPVGRSERQRLEKMRKANPRFQGRPPYA